MLSKETPETYRRMTPGERLVLALCMPEQNIPALFEGSPEMVTRRFEMLARENDERNRNMLTAIARTRDRADIDDLLLFRSEFDEPYLRRWAGPLGVEQRLDEVLASRE